MLLYRSEPVSISVLYNLPMNQLQRAVCHADVQMNLCASFMPGNLLCNSCVPYCLQICIVAVYQFVLVYLCAKYANGVPCQCLNVFVYNINTLV